jgi:hypothetical protein
MNWKVVEDKDRDSNVPFFENVMEIHANND